MLKLADLLKRKTSLINLRMGNFYVDLPDMPPAIFLNMEYILYMAMDDLHYDVDTPFETLRENTRVAQDMVNILKERLTKEWKARIKDSSVSRMQDKSKGEV